LRALSAPAEIATGPAGDFASRAGLIAHLVIPENGEQAQSTTGAAHGCDSNYKTEPAG
jgi:hypothetical protein